MTFIHKPPITGFMTGYDQDQRAWIQGILDREGITPTELARRAGLDPSTLTRFMGGERDGHMLSARTVRKIEAVTVVKPPQPSGMREDAVPYSAEAVPPSPLGAALAAMRSGRNGLDAWLVTSRKLEGLRIFEGDILMVDLNAEPRPGDVVCAQIYDWQHGGAQTVFRLYEPPFLLSGDMTGPARRPEAVDGRNIQVRGVVVARLSPRDMLHLAS